LNLLLNSLSKSGYACNNLLKQAKIGLP